MGSKWTDLSGSAAAYPAYNLQRSALQLSDGTLIFIDYTGTSYYLKYWPRSGSPTTIASLGSMSGPVLARDASNNLYVASTPSSGNLTFQAFAKGSGYSWTAETAHSISFGAGAITLMGLQWANTGGGTGGGGHLLLDASWFPTSSTSAAGGVVADAGALLAGSAPTTSSNTFVTFGTVTGLYGAGAPDGFGATTGMRFSVYNGGGSVTAATWSLSSSGVLTYSAASGSAPTTSSGPPRITCGRVGSGQWMVVYPKSDGSGNYGATYVTAASGFGSSGYSVTLANWPSYGDNGHYDLFVDPTTAGQVWAIAPGTVSGGSLPVYRLACTLSSSNVPTWSTSVVVDDTLSIYALPTVNIVAVRDPVISDVDWALGAQTASTPTYAVLGDYSVLATTPSCVLTGPANGAYVDASALAMSWTYSDTDGSTEAAWALRYKVSGAGSYTYWNASTGLGQSTIVWNTGGAMGWTPPSGVFTNDSTYNWSPAVQSSYGLQSAFPTDSTFICQVAPTVTITAPSGGTQATSQPTVTYTTTAATGASLTAYRIMCYPAAIASGGGFTPGVTTGAVWDTGVVTGAPPGGGVLIGTPLSNTANYVVCMTVWETGNEQSAWAVGSSFEVLYGVPATPSFSAVNGTDTNGVPAVVLTITEALTDMLDGGSAGASGSGGVIDGGSASGSGSGGTIDGGSAASPTADSNYTVTVTYTDANGSGTLRYGQAVSLTLGSPATIYDYEATPGVARTYTATVSALSGGALVTAVPATATATLSISTWWLIDPVEPAASIAASVTAFTSSQNEAVAVHYPLSPTGTVTPPSVISAGLTGQDGQLTVQTQSQSQYDGLLASAGNGRVKWVISPLSTGTYARTAAANPTGGSQSGMAHQTTLSPSPSTTPVRSSVITYVAVGAP